MESRAKTFSGRYRQSPNPPPSSPQGMRFPAPPREAGSGCGGRWARRKLRTRRPPSPATCHPRPVLPPTLLPPATVATPHYKQQGMQTTKSGYRQHVTQHRPRGSQSASDHHCSLSASLRPCGGRRSHTWKGRGPSAGKSTLLGAVAIYPDPGQQGNNLSRSRGDWIRSGAWLLPSGFPSPPTTCLNFSL